MPKVWTWARLSGLTLVATLAACGGYGDPVPQPEPQPVEPPPVILSAQASLGATLFRERSLAASGAMSCNTCHNAGIAYAPDNDLAVQLGGPQLDVAGTRAVPSLRYMAETPAFHFDAAGRPVGGFNRDGRMASLEAQAERPFLAPHEMGNISQAEVLTRLGRAEVADEFRRVYGAAIFDDRSKAFAALLGAIAAFERESPDFQPFEAKYDYVLSGRAALTPAEARGLAVFNDPARGNCALCHPSAQRPGGKPPLFTDFGYDNLGVPRNAAIPANAQPDFYDLGLCGPDRTDLATRTDLCGFFKTPTLRNVATRQAFFHNGVFKDLREVLRFYATRDTHPERWYPRAADGSVQKFNDLPPALRGNVNTTVGPYGRQPGMAPAFSEADIDDLLAFLNTLTDGYRLPPQ